MDKQAALFLLGLLARTSIRGRDAANLYAAQQWLSGIADGRLVVIAKEEAAPPTPANQKGKKDGKLSKRQTPGQHHGNGVAGSAKL